MHVGEDPQHRGGADAVADVGVQQGHRPRDLPPGGPGSAAHQGLHPYHDGLRPEHETGEPSERHGQGYKEGRPGRHRQSNRCEQFAFGQMGHADIDLAANAAAVLKAGGSNPLASCSDIAQTLPDIRALLPAEAEDEDDEDEDESEDDVDPDAKSKGKGKGKNDSGWWRKEEFQIKKETELETIIKKEKDAMDAGYKLLKKDFEAHLLTCSPACLLSYLFAC